MEFTLELEYIFHISRHVPVNSTYYLKLNDQELFLIELITCFPYFLKLENIDKFELIF